jgi:hypothetical protein
LELPHLHSNYAIRGSRHAGDLPPQEQIVHQRDGRAESFPHSEVRTLGYPRAALFAFSVAILAFNALSAVRLTAGDYYLTADGAYPNSAGAGVIGQAIWQNIQDNCIAHSGRGAVGSEARAARSPQQPS